MATRNTSRKPVRSATNPQAKFVTELAVMNAVVRMPMVAPVGIAWPDSVATPITSPT